MAKNTTEVVTTSPALPALFEGNDLLDSGTIKLPGIYLNHALSQATKDGVATPGEMIVKRTPDDAAPLSLGKKGDSFDAYIIHVDVSYARFEDGGMEWLTKAEFEKARLDREYGVWRVFRYTCYVPDFGEVLPVSLMLTRMAGKAASEQINTLLAQRQLEGNNKPVGVRLSTRERSSKNGKHTYDSWVAVPIPADDVPEGALDTANGMRSFIQSASYQEPSTDVEGAPAL